MNHLSTHRRAISPLLRVLFTGFLPHTIKVEVCQPRDRSADAACPQCGIEACLKDILCLRPTKEDINPACLLRISSLPGSCHLGTAGGCLAFAQEGMQPQYLQSLQGLTNPIHSCNCFLVLCTHSEISGSGPGPVTPRLASSARAQAMSCGQHEHVSHAQRHVPRSWAFSAAPSQRGTSCRAILHCTRHPLHSMLMRKVQQRLHYTCADLLQACSLLRFILKIGHSMSQGAQQVNAKQDNAHERGLYTPAAYAQSTLFDQT